MASRTRRGRRKAAISNPARAFRTAKPPAILSRCPPGSISCAAGTGATTSAARGGAVENRIAEHNDGTFGGYTSSRRPVALVYAQEFDRITDAITAEQQVKRWSRAKKEALIAGDFDLLRDPAKRRTRHD